MKRIALLAVGLAASSPSCKAASLLAQGARVGVGGRSLVVGVSDPGANAQLGCSESQVQHTIRRCQIPAALVSAATCLGRRVAGVTLNVHFQGQVQNMSVEFAPGTSADDVLAQLKAAFSKEPKVQYWADDAHLFASYIWVDGEAEVELTKTVKGPSDGKARMFVSSLLGGLPISPEDQ